MARTIRMAEASWSASAGAVLEPAQAEAERLGNQIELIQEIRGRLR